MDNDLKEERTHITVLKLGLGYGFYIQTPGLLIRSRNLFVVRANAETRALEIICALKIRQWTLVSKG